MVELDLSDQNLSNDQLEVFCQDQVFCHIHYLYLNNNQLSKVPPNFGLCFPNLRWLDLRHNLFESWPLVNTKRQEQLHTVLIQANPLKKFELQICSASPLKTIQTSEPPLVHEAVEDAAEDVEASDSGVGSSLGEIMVPHWPGLGLDDSDLVHPAKDCLDAIDEAIAKEEWTLLPDQWNLLKKAIEREVEQEQEQTLEHDPHFRDKRGQRTKRKRRSKAKTPKATAAVGRMGPSMAEVRLRAEQERQRRREIAQKNEINRQLQKMKDQQVLLLWRRSRSLHPAPVASAESQRLCRPWGQEGKTYSQLLAEGVTREDYHLLMDQLCDEIDRILARGSSSSSTTTTEDVVSSRIEANRIRGQFMVLRSAMKRTNCQRQENCCDISQ